MKNDVAASRGISDEENEIDEGRDENSTVNRDLYNLSVMEAFLAVDPNTVEHIESNTDLYQARIVRASDSIFNFWTDLSVNDKEFEKKNFNNNRRDLEKVVNYVLNHGWRPILITVPVTQTLEKIMDENDFKQSCFYSNVEKLRLPNSVPYLDFSSNPRFEVIKNNPLLFEDGNHLNKHGAKVFSYFMLRELIELGYLGEEVDGYE